MRKIALITDANQGLGLVLARGLARPWGDDGFVYLGARDMAAQASTREDFVAAVRPGLVDTDASRPWFADMSKAQSPDAAAAPIVAIATGEAGV